MSTTTRPGAVLAVTSSAAFLSSLDLFIVNIAFPDIRADRAPTWRRCRGS